MKIIVPCNNKGGVGKTALSAMIADYCSKILKKNFIDRFRSTVQYLSKISRNGGGSK